MNMIFLLMAQCDNRFLIPIYLFARDNLDVVPGVLIRKIYAGQVKLPIVQMEDSQKAAMGVHIQDLAAYLDERAEAARRECRQLYT